MINNRYFKTTIGVGAEVVIAKTLDTSGAASAPQATYQGFVDNAPAGALGVFWQDTKAALAAGDTANYANANRKFFYAYKLSATSVKNTAPIPCSNRTYTKAPYNAGTPDTFTMTIAGTITPGQTLYIRIQEITGGILPYPVYSYEVPYNTSNNQTAADIAAAINAEKDEKILSATAAGNVVTITTTDKQRNIKVLAPQLNTTVAAPNNQAVFTVAQTVKGVLPLGDATTMNEIAREWKIMQGGIEYTQEGLTADNFGILPTNNDTSVNYGFLVVGCTRREEGQGSVHAVTRKSYTIVAIATAQLNTLAAY